MSKDFNRERSNGVAQGREDSRWMRERIAELESGLRVAKRRIEELEAGLRVSKRRIEGLEYMLDKIDASRT